MPGDERGLRRPRQDLILSGQNIFINQPRQVICLVNIVAECAIAVIIVCQCYGAGNMPSNREDLLEAVTEAARSGVMVLVVTIVTMNPESCSRRRIRTQKQTRSAHAEN